MAKKIKEKVWTRTKGAIYCFFHGGKIITGILVDEEEDAGMGNRSVYTMRMLNGLLSKEYEIFTCGEMVRHVEGLAWNVETFKNQI